MRSLHVFALTCAIMGQSACAQTSEQPTIRGESQRLAEGPAPAIPKGGIIMDEGVANLPFARGHKFPDLDNYLAYLAKYNGTIDMPWWREISPGVYRYEIRMAGNDAEPETATRAELEKRFGFTGTE